MRLSTHMNYAIFIKEVMGDRQKAMKKLEMAIVQGLEHIKECGDRTLIDAENIIKVMKENVDTW